MADVTIESIAIEITAAADSADKALERLSKNLETLRSVCASGLEGANKVADGLKKIAEAANYFNSVDEGKMKSVASALRAIGKIESVPNLTPFARSIAKVVEATNSVSTEQMTSFVTNMRSFSSAMQPLSSLSGLGDLSGAINALKGLPKVAKGLSQMNLGTFAQQMQQITTAIQPFVTQMQNLSSSFTNMPAPIQQAVAGIVNYNTAVNNADDRTRSLGKSLKLLNFTAMYFAIRKVVNILGKFITSSNEYVENLNLFRVTMGETADEALEFANTVNKVMGIDVSQWIKNQGVFKQMTSGFGMVEEKANLVSKNLTQLGYDISSYFNIRVEDAMQKLQSAMAGEQEPLRRLGYALDEATLKQVALNHGIETSTTNMSQAQKAQLRYIAIMEQSTNAMGDMARTIESPANQIRILESRIQTLKRAIGDSLMPVVSAALPYVTAFVQILGEFFRDVAEFLGFELPKFDYSDVVTKGNEDIASSFDEATKASKEFKGTLASIDQLNIIGTKTEKGSGTGNLFGADLDLDLPSYDFLGNLKAETSEAYNTIKNFVKEALPWLEAFAAAWGAIFVGKKIGGFITSLSNLKTAMLNVFGENATKITKTIGSIAGGLAAGASSGILMYNGLKNLISGTGSLAGNIVKLAAGLGIAGGAIAAFIKLGSPVGAVITGIGAALGLVIGAIQGSEEKARALNKEIMNNVLYKNGGTKITEIADAFSDWATAQKNVNDKITAEYAELEQYSENMQGVLDELDEITGYEVDFSKMTPADAEALKEPFAQLTTYLKGDFTTNVNAVATSLQDAFTNLNIGEGIAAEVQGALKGVERAFDKTLTENDKIVADYLDKIAEGKTLSQTDLDDLSKRYSVQTKLTLLNDENVQNAKKAFEDLDLSKIDLEDESTAMVQLQKISDTSNALAQSIKDRIQTESVSLDRMMEQYKIMYEGGIMDKATFDKQTDIIKLSKNILAQNAAAQMTELRDSVKSITDPLWEQIESKKGTLSTSFMDNLAAFAGDISAQDIAWSKWVDSSEVFKQLQTMDYERTTYSVSVDTDFTYATEEAAKMAQIVQQDITPETDILIGKLQDDTGELKYLVGKESALLKANVTQIMGNDGWKILTGEKTAQIKAELVNSPFTEEHKAYLSSEDAEKAASAPWRMPLGIQNTLIPIKNNGADPESVRNVTNAATAGLEMAANFTIYNVTELDGDTVAESVTRTQQRQMVYSNGM